LRRTAARDKQSTFTAALVPDLFQKRGNRRVDLMLAENA